MIQYIIDSTVAVPSRTLSSGAAGRNRGGVREKGGRGTFGAFHLACDLKSGAKA